MKLLVLALFVLEASAPLVPPLRGAAESGQKVYGKYGLADGKSITLTSEEVSTTSTTDDVSTTSTTDDGSTTPPPDKGVNGGTIASIIAIILVVLVFTAAGLHFMKTESFCCFK